MCSKLHYRRRMQGVGVGTCEALGLAGDLPLRYELFCDCGLERGCAGGRGEAETRHSCEAGWAGLKMRDVGRVAVLLVTVWCAANGIGDEGCKALALALAKHSGLQMIGLQGTGCFVIAVWSGEAGTRHACEAGWA